MLMIRCNYPLHKPEVRITELDTEQDIKTRREGCVPIYWYSEVYYEAYKGDEQNASQGLL